MNGLVGVAPRRSAPRRNQAGSRDDLRTHCRRNAAAAMGALL